MKNHSLFASLLIASGAFGALPAMAVVPPVDGAGRAAQTSCPTTLNAPAINHYDKVIFQLAPGNLTPALAADFNALNAIPRDTELDIKILDNPRTVAELKGKVLTFLGAQNIPANRLLLKITDVEYASVVCPRAQ